MNESQSGPVGSDELTERLLDAAIEAVSIHGLARTTMSDVASRAGVSRPTLYKRFGSKDELVTSAVLREAARMVDTVLHAAEEHSEPEEAFEATVVVALRVARDHPLLDRIVRTEPEALVPIIVADPSPVLGFVRDAVQRVVDVRVAGLSDIEVRRLSDTIARLLVSYALTPPDDPPEVVARHLAALVTANLTGTVGSAVREDR